MENNKGHQIIQKPIYGLGCKPNSYLFVCQNCLRTTYSITEMNSVSCYEEFQKDLRKNWKR